jgi:hypothetical protein
MVYLLGTLDLWRVVREVLVDGKSESESAALIYAFVRFDMEEKVENIVGIREFRLHSGR